MVLIIITLVCLLLFVLILINAIEQAKDMPETWEDLRLNRKIDRAMYQLLQDLKKKQEEFKN